MGRVYHILTCFGHIISVLACRPGERRGHEGNPCLSSAFLRYNLDAAMKYRAIFFDAGGTLFRPHPSVGALYARVADNYGMRVDAGALETLFRAEFARRDGLVSTAHASEKNEKEWWKLLVRDVFKPLVELRRFDDFFEELYDLFARAEAWRLYAEVPSVLESLKERKLTLGIVSNWDSRLFSICEGMRLEPYFDFILASAVVGSAKPDSGIFCEALRRAGVRPAEALHVGDSIENDILGAKRAGIPALFINRGGRSPENIPAISSLREIFAHL